MVKDNQLNKKEKDTIEVHKLLVLALVAIILILGIVSYNLYKQVNDIDYCVLNNDTLNVTIADNSSLELNDTVKDFGINITMEQELYINLTNNS